IPEEATRIANFQTGKIDLFAAAPDSIPALADIPETRFMSQGGSSESHLGFYGMWHDGVGTEDERAGWDPEAPYISSNSDPSSPEWERARKVRLAMGLAIDRDKLVQELLRGEGSPLSMWGWASPYRGPSGDLRANPDWKWEYDPERARQLLTEAGYGDGFEVELTPSIRGAPAEVEACEAIADMWQDVGITARLQRIPFNTLVEGQFKRTNTGITCHAAQPLVEPLVLYGFMFDPVGSWSAGSDHPVLTSLLHEASTTFDTEDRWAMQMEMANWIWDNSFDVGLYSVNNIYPLGPKIDTWEEHLETGDPRRLSALEFAPHRK
ncbi:MAG: ABC transporter substrate-binding protein, partial [Chloroflexi bacterium]|nr:ABC transporter substrate-binding protein [Chloroflexota bacterium]